MDTLIGNLIFWGFIIFLITIFRRKRKTRQYTTSDENRPNEDMGKFRTVVDEETITLEDNTYNVFTVKARGLIPYTYGNSVSFTTSILDITEGYEYPDPVLSMIDSFQESRSRFYLSSRNYGIPEENTGWPDWVKLNYAIKDSLVFPEKGTRKLLFITQAISSKSIGNIYRTNAPKEDSYGFSEVIHEYYSNKIGYKDFEKNSEESQEISIFLAVYTAMSDGTLHDKEGEKIKQWIERILGNLEDPKKEERKIVFNSTLREAHKNFKSKEFNRYVKLTGMNSPNNPVEVKILRLSEIGTAIDKTECLELIMDVMVSDGVMHDKELEFVNQIGERFEIKPETISSMRDTRILDLEELNSSTKNIDDILGIDTTQSNKEIKEYLNDQFSKWNSRVESLVDETERENANQMLELIAQARKKYK